MWNTAGNMSQWSAETERKAKVDVEPCTSIMSLSDEILQQLANVNCTINVLCGKVDDVNQRLDNMEKEHNIWKSRLSELEKMVELIGKEQKVMVGID